MEVNSDVTSFTLCIIVCDIVVDILNTVHNALWVRNTSLDRILKNVLDAPEADVLFKFVSNPCGLPSDLEIT